MKKAISISAVVTVIVLVVILTAGCIPRVSHWTCPMAVMVNGQVYTTGSQKAAVIPENSQISGYIRSAVPASTMPAENGQSNFQACVDQPYAFVNGALLLYYGGQWNTCHPRS